MMDLSVDGLVAADSVRGWFGLMASCIRASLSLSTASATTLGPSYDPMRNHRREHSFPNLQRPRGFYPYLNDHNLSCRLKVNESADLTTSEFASRYSGDKHSNVLSGLKHLRTHEYVGQPPVNVVDWTVMGAVTPVKNLEQCDSGWAVSTTSSLEGDGYHRHR